MADDATGREERLDHHMRTAGVTKEDAESSDDYWFWDRVSQACCDLGDRNYRDWEKEKLHFYWYNGLAALSDFHHLGPRSSL
jgi:hypothetical protein